MSDDLFSLQREVKALRETVAHLVKRTTWQENRLRSMSFLLTRLEATAWINPFKAVEHPRLQPTTMAVGVAVGTCAEASTVELIAALHMPVRLYSNEGVLIMEAPLQAFGGAGQSYTACPPVPWHTLGRFDGPDVVAAVVIQLDTKDELVLSREGNGVTMRGVALLPRKEKK